MHLKCSKGSRQELQMNEALQAVDPNGEISFVSLLLHIGQGIIRPSPVRKALSWLDPSGGAIPFAVIFPLASLEIQSVVQAGDNAILISALGSISLADLSTSSEITSVAGHPEYVGVITQTMWPFSKSTPLSIPISLTLRKGSSGSITSCNCLLTSLISSEGERSSICAK